MSAGYYADHNVVHHLDLEVAEGEIVCVIGPNGAGKSTALRAIYGLAEVRSGHVLCDGADITGIAPRMRCVLPGWPWSPSSEASSRR